MENYNALDLNGDIVARDNLLLVFNRKCPFAEMVEAARYCCERFVEIIPPESLKWALVGKTSDEDKPLTKQILNRCLSMLKTSMAKQKDISFCLGSEIFCPNYRLKVYGKKEPDEQGYLDTTNLIEMRFPVTFLSEFGTEQFIATAKEFAEKISCDSSYASFSFCYKETKVMKAGNLFTPKALRFHGYDIATNFSTSLSMGKKCRGARWLTMLSNDLISQLGGLDSLKGKLLEGVDVITTTNGVLLRAGKNPEIGDVNKKEGTPLLASVAHAIEKVTYFHDNSLLPLFNHDPEKRDRWERRFWPNEV